MDDEPTVGPRSASDVATEFDLMGRTAVVTGAGTGVGLQVVRALAHADASVIAAMSDPERDRPRLQALQVEIEGASIRIATLDLTDLASVRRFVLAFLQTAQPLQLLLHTEQVVPGPVHVRSVDGFEQSFAAYLGQFALTAGMHTALRRSADPRVITLSSAGHVLADVDLEDPGFTQRRYNAWHAYGQAMSAGALFSVAFTQHFSAEGLGCNVVDPGVLDPLSLLAYPPDEVARHANRHDEAAAQVVWAALAAELDGSSGHYLMDYAQAHPWPEGTELASARGSGFLPRVMDPGRALRLWDMSHSMIRGLGGW